MNSWSFAETLGGIGNIFPTTLDNTKKSPRDKAAEDDQSLQREESSTAATIAGILAFRNASLYSYDTTTSAFFGWTYINISFTDTAAASTMSHITAQTSPMPPLSKTVTMTISPRNTMENSFFNGDSLTISGFSVSTLTVNSRVTTSEPKCTSTITSLPLIRTVPTISDFMLRRPSTHLSPFDWSAKKLRSLPEDQTYDELFTYIFDDCLLFRKVKYIS